MITGMNQSIALALVFAGYLVLVLIMGIKFRRLRLREFVIVFVIAIVVAIRPMVLPRLGYSTDNWRGLWMQAAGVGFAVVALALQIWARVYLGKNHYTELPDKLIDAGPYAFSRNPIFVSFLVAAIGLFLIDPAATTFAVVAYAFIYFRGAAIREEKLLASQVLGYEKYKEETPRFLIN